jgi:hypothetical protein
MAKRGGRKKPPATLRAIAKLLGRNGGYARARKLTKQQRIESARKAIRARWAKAKAAAGAIAES